MELDDFQKELIEVQEQRSQPWRDARAGKFTASEMWKLMTSPRSKNAEFSETALTYIMTKVAEEVTGRVHESGPAYPLVWGEEQEPIAKQYITDKLGIEIKPAGFVIRNAHSGGTPDGYIGEDEILEIKCPFNSANHVEYLLLKTPEDLLDFKKENFYQVHTNMLFCNRPKSRLISYDGRFPESQQLAILNVPADSQVQAAIIERLDKAIQKKLEILKHFELP